ncbi:PREDICTED: putative F-box/LRR-repeat protein At3g18150 [Camelina sativa]|uniref:F-box/LRR-repeat protein At3g18150 n=1 Tax=Camelina sativa TaxID=90675 RepID=A0ABM0W5B9_CAMSA|nr:PREDICTED: putative F-box/LRR-repeat protein At3g18150 [Camelina sativa]XP_010465896.1 PREDICTED: putative F-box/LRR-repeat protein At3g18150 [Camelina sativa]XP_010465897.1 PREDICTED: putative F-box/LRR-repeat protein At3g18150 [Camelina sativa]
MEARIHQIYTMMVIPRCSVVSWTSLKKLYLGDCALSDESMAAILSGCPVLECLTLDTCGELKVLDLSKSLCLRTLDIYPYSWVPGPTQILAPHVHNLILVINSQLACTSFDVSYLAEARLEICIFVLNNVEAGFLQDVVLKMLEKLQNVEKLTLGGNFLHILSLAEVRSVPFPKLKVKDLTLKTLIFQYVIPSIERLLQNSPDLKKLTVRVKSSNYIRDYALDDYLELQGFNPDQCWRSKDGVSFNKVGCSIEPKHVTSLLELVLKNTKTLDNIAVIFDERYPSFKLEEVVVPTLSHKNVSIALLYNQTDP